MKLFDILKDILEGKKSGLPLATPADLVRVSYGLAYFVLPDLAHRQFGEFLRSWRDRYPFNIMLCDFGCSKAKVRTTMEQKASFKTQEGQLFANWDYYLVEFPTPPPFVRMSDEELTACVRTGKKTPTLAPYFAVIVHDRVTDERRHYTLGQSPSGDTTFRSVTADDANCNLGPGPAPNSAAFLDHVRKTLQNGEQVWAKS